MRSSRIKLIDLIPLREADEEENPFAGGDAAEGGDDTAAAEGDADAEKGGEKGAKADTDQKPNVKFDIASVKQYNDNEFTSDTGMIISADKNGLQVMVLPDEVPITVNFQDVI